MSVGGRCYTETGSTDSDRHLTQPCDRAHRNAGIPLHGSTIGGQREMEEEREISCKAEKERYSEREKDSAIISTRN